MVSNFAYTHYSLVQPTIHERIIATEKVLWNELAASDAQALDLIRAGASSQLSDLMNQQADRLGTRVVKDWLALWQQLFVTHRDGFIVSAPTVIPVPDHGGKMGGVVPKVVEPGYSNEWKQRIALDTGDRLAVPTLASTKSAASRK